MHLKVAIQIPRREATLARGEIKLTLRKGELRGADEAEAIRIELEKRRRVAKIRSTKMPHFSGGDLSVLFEEDEDLEKREEAWHEYQKSGG